MTQKHTPIPWHVASQDDYDCEVVCNETGRAVCHAVDKINATFITDACNIEGAWIKATIEPKDGQDILMQWDYGVTLLGKWFESLGYATPASKGSHWVGKIGVCRWMPAESWTKARAEATNA